MRVWWRYHKIANGDTLAGIARKYHTTTSTIATVNNLQSGDDLAVDSKLIIPITPGREADPDRVAYSKKVVRYKVRQGDTVLSVADEWGVPPEMIRKWNKIRGNDLRRGRSLVIHRPLTDSAHVSGDQGKARASRSQAAASEVADSSKSKKKNSLSASDGNRRQTHKVKAGESLWSIASQYHTSVEALRRENGAVAAHLQPGDVLVISSDQ
jgi:membrane-bound lytic murein transglycosylase D